MVTMSLSCYEHLFHKIKQHQKLNRTYFTTRIKLNTSLFPLASLEGAVGGDLEEFEVIKPIPYKPVGVDEGGEIQIGSIILQVVSGDITLEKTNAIVNGTNRYLRHKGSATFSLRHNEPMNL